MNHRKIVHASQGPIRMYEDLKRKLYFCNAHIYFNKQCAKKQLVPSYARIKVPNTSPAAKFTLEYTPLPAKNEISFPTSTAIHNVQHPPRGLLSFLISTILDLKMAP